MTLAEWLDKWDPSDTQRSDLVAHRGGCSCCVAPPCNAHTDPITEQEACELGFVEKCLNPACEGPAVIDDMKAEADRIIDAVSVEGLTLAARVDKLETEVQHFINLNKILGNA